MNNINLFLILYCAVLIFKNEIRAHTAKCDYNYGSHSATGYRANYKYYYGCGFKTKLVNYSQPLTAIDGQHKTGQTDGDIKFVENFVNQKLKTFSSIFCDKFPNLEFIKIINADLESIEENSLQKCENLDRLSLDENRIHELPKYLLYRNVNIIFLKINRNQLISLPESFFVNQKQLKELILSENEIKSLQSKIFDPLLKLEILFLSDNNLESINPEWFKNLYNLNHLTLDKNKFTKIPSKCFELLKNLEKLFLFENKIVILHSDSFDGLSNLKVLNLRNNEIIELPVGVFTKLINLQKLSLENNKLSTIHSNSFGFNYQLTEFYLQDNKINSIDPKFIDNTAISTLNMSNNICINLFLRIKSKIKSNLINCFMNYQPQLRTQTSTQVYTTSQPTIQTNTCGKFKTGHGNIIGGTHIKSGDYPWIAALMAPKGKLICVGSLVSSRKVVTAAHCIQEKKSTSKLTANNIVVLLGAHDLNNPVEIGRAFHAVYSINVHPDWNTLTYAYDADIAVLVLETEVIFGLFIQPICLPTLKLNIATIWSGLVVGYGKSEDKNKEHENIPKILTTPIHNNLNCFKDNEDLILLSSGRTFCGGSGKGVGVCSGDSGGGLIVTYGSAYYLRGIVSSSLSNAQRECDVDTYAIFTDVIKFVDWINGISTDRFATFRKNIALKMIN